jgi:hypothetical protein
MSLEQHLMQKVLTFSKIIQELKNPKQKQKPTIMRATERALHGQS